MIYIGIDVGKNGGFAIIYPCAISVGAWDDAAFISVMQRIALNEDEVIACVEKVGAMPGESPKASFSFGRSAGFIEGVLKSLNIPYQLARPQEWKKEFGLIGTTKQQSIETCERLFPMVGKYNLLYRTKRCKKKHDGMAEALLLAEYARRCL